jgi:hypothetical protein
MLILRPALLDQLIAYVKHRDSGYDSGWYYGDKKQFESRHNELLKLLELERSTAAKDEQ